MDEPGSSVSLPAATAVEIEVRQPPAAFAQGICIGFATAAVLAAVWLATQLAPMREAHLDMGDGWTEYTPLSASQPTRQEWWFLTKWWLWGVPAAGAIAVGFLVLRRPRRLWPYLAVALVLAAAVVGTWWYANAPLRELAGNISAD